MLKCKQSNTAHHIVCALIMDTGTFTRISILSIWDRLKWTKTHICLVRVLHLTRAYVAPIYHAPVRRRKNIHRRRESLCFQKNCNWQRSTFTNHTMNPINMMQIKVCMLSTGTKTDSVTWTAKTSTSKWW